MHPRRDAATRHTGIGGIGCGSGLGADQLSGGSTFVVAYRAEHAAHRLGREPAGEQEAGVARAIGRRLGRRLEATLPDRTRALELGTLERGNVHLHQRFVEPVRAHFVADRGHAEAFGAPMHERLGEALVRQQARRGQIVEQRLELRGAFGVRSELAGQLGAAVFAPREQAQRTRLQRRAAGFQAAASSGAAPRPATP